MARAPSCATLTATVRSAAEAAASSAPDLPLLAGGKSLGGRMTSLAYSEDRLPKVKGLVFFGFPLHPAGKPATEDLTPFSLPRVDPSKVEPHTQDLILGARVRRGAVRPAPDRRDFSRRANGGRDGRPSGTSGGSACR